MSYECDFCDSKNDVRVLTIRKKRQPGESREDHQQSGYAYMLCKSCRADVVENLKPDEQIEWD
jgi:hypothetical protein